MDTWQQIQELPNKLYLLGKKDDAAVSDLDALLFNVFGERLDRKCGYCINKAYVKLTNLTHQRFTEMKDQKYKLKDGIVVYYQHTHFTNANITDDVAEQMVKDNPANADNFVTAPEVKTKAVKQDKAE